MARARRIGVVAVGLAAVGAAAGGVLAALATVGLLVVARGPRALTGGWDVIGVFALIGAAVGAVLAPFAALVLLRHVPLGRALTATALGTVAGAAVGIAFTTPDVLELARGAPPRTAILKTLAVLPEPTYSGLGSLMTDRTHAAARALGYDRVIHALMHESNRSRKISSHTGQPLRRYALFGRSL